MPACNEQNCQPKKEVKMRLELACIIAIIITLPIMGILSLFIVDLGTILYSGICLSVVIFWKASTFLESLD